MNHRATRFRRLTLFWHSLPLSIKGLVVVLIPLMALVVASLSYLMLDTQGRRAEAAMRHQAEVRAVARDITNTLRRAESGVRGYLLIGSESLLEPYRQARAQVFSRSEALADLIEMSSAQERRLAKSQALTLQFLDNLARLLDPPDGPTAEDLAVAVDAEALLDELSATLANIRESEEARHASRFEATRTIRQATILSIAVSLFVGIVGGVVATLLFTTGVSRRIWLLEANAQRLAEGQRLLPLPPGNDEIGNLGAELERTSRLLDMRSIELKRAQIEALDRLAQAADYRDDQSGGHTQRVGEISSMIAEALGLLPDEVALIRRAAPLHDVGKIALPDDILLKPSTLSKHEFDAMKLHTSAGATMLGRGQFRLIQVAEEIAISHHERWDGAGYPNGKSGEDIPLVGRIVAVADAFDALLSARPYKPAWRLKEAVAEIRAKSGSQFDPQVVEAFARIDWESWYARQNWIRQAVHQAARDVDRARPIAGLPETPDASARRS